MNNVKKYFPFLLSFVALLIIFKSWFMPGLLSAGDFPGSYPSFFTYPNLYPYAWYWNISNGLGGFSSQIATIFFIYSLPFTLLVPFVHFSISIIERIGYFYPFLIIGIFSSYYLVNQLFIKSKFSLLTIVIYLTNTYILMITGGGQLSVMLGYAITPLILGVFLKFFNTSAGRFNFTYLQRSLIIGILLAVQLLFDARWAYITLAAVFLYFIITLIQKELRRKFVGNIIFIFITIGIAGLIHAFWLLPLLIEHQNPIAQLGSAYSSIGAVQYFSFAKLENTMSLLHPNWPENIFGKVSFMRPEFLVIPILAFAALLFINRKNKREFHSVLYFALLGLIGAFLAKGANDPFGGLYLWLFNHVPGFVMFRDPTKWYTLVALSYSVLIPFSVWKIYEWLREHHKFSIFNFQFPINSKNTIFNVQNIFVVVFILFWLFTIRQAVFGQLGGTFKSTSVPVEYSAFANYLANQPQFSRTLWVPTTQRFGFSSQNHPAISAQDLFAAYNEKSLIKKIMQPGTENKLQEMGVKYVIVPTDSQKEIFLKDRVYSEQLYKKTVSDVSQIAWLHPINHINNLAIFEVPSPKDHFWSPSGSMQISYTFINPVTYSVHVTNAKKGDLLIFSESYDSHWTANSISSIPYDKLFNSFVLSKDGSYTLKIYYTPQKWVNIGVWVSSISFILLAGSLAFILIKRKRGGQ